MKSKKYTDEEFIEAVKTSISVRQALQKLGVIPAGGNYASFHRRVKKLGLDTSHFKGQGHSAGQTIGPKRPIEDHLSNKYGIKSHALRQRLIREGFFSAKCYQCGLKEWNNQPIPLELEHKDGNHNNNNLDNLTILCPNCHAQTPTYRRIKK